MATDAGFLKWLPRNRAFRASVIKCMQRTNVTSRAIRSVGYSVRHQTLEIEFHDGDLYAYEDVPAHVHQSLMAADSKGGYFARRVRDQFPMRKVSSGRK